MIGKTKQGDGAKAAAIVTADAGRSQGECAFILAISSCNVDDLGQVASWVQRSGSMPAHRLIEGQTDR